jgi:1-pyrroline-5-carboxylate dehydrogenase
MVVDDVRSPIDTSWLVARAQRSSPAEVAEAVALADAGCSPWRARPWPQRVALLRAAADRLSEASLELAAWMMLEVGKTRLEALAEAEEAADLLRYYAAQLEGNAGYRRPLLRLAPEEATESVFQPYGVFAVISPFNFPLALAAGMIAAALVTGNTVVFKPSEDSPVIGVRLAEELWAAGVPRDALQVVLGPGESTGAALVADPRIAGVAFTGSHAVGMELLHALQRERPRPVVLEMGGKNATIVTGSTDLTAAARAVARSAYGFSGQKCSACSRVYVTQDVAAPFVERLVAQTNATVVGDPTGAEDPGTGPVIHARAVAAFSRYVEAVRAAGGEILAGGEVLRDGAFARGHFVEPTLARLPDRAHPLFAEEMFLPLLLVATARDLDDAIAEANRSPYGLTAGLMSGDAAEVERFLARIEAGVVYVNRKSGSTTGAWPGVNSFGGWKGSGTGGPAALGPHYLLKFLREQSRTVNPSGER